MRTSPEEALLILNKWRSASSRLIAFVTSPSGPPADFAVRLEGVVTRIESETGVVLFKSGDNFIMCRLSDVIEYNESIESLAAELSQVLGLQRQEWKTVLCLVYSRATILFCESL
jgi:hypothetical protein